jgi:predicted sulfurtransferase
MRKSGRAAGIVAAALLFTAGISVAGEKPSVTKPCIGCHDAEEGLVRGRLTNLSKKASTLQVSVGKATWVFSFDQGTSFANTDSLKGLKPNGETAVTFARKGKRLYASSIAVKPKFKVPEDQLVDTAYIQKLVEKTPEEGKFVLVDARPGPKYHEGHIKNAVSMPFPAFDKMKGKVLPAAKDIQVIFYCGGVT